MSFSVFIENERTYKRISKIFIVFMKENKTNVRVHMHVTHSHGECSSMYSCTGVERCFNEC